MLKLVAVFVAGTTVEEAGEELFRVGLAMENTGHINKQALAGKHQTLERPLM